MAPEVNSFGGLKYFSGPKEMWLKLPFSAG